MHSHVNLSTSTTEHISPNQTFSSWFKSRSLFYATPLIAVISSIYVFPAIYHYSHESLRSIDFLSHPDNIYMILYCLNIAFALVFIYKLLNTHDNKRGYYRASQVYRRIFNEGFNHEHKRPSLKKTEKILQQFKTYFTCFWVTMILLYLLLYYDVRFPSREVIFSSENPDGVWTRGMPIYVINILCAMCILFCFALFNSPPIAQAEKKKYKKDIKIIVFASSVLIMLYPILFFTVKNTGHYYTIFHNILLYSVSGVIYGVSLALFIARLDSKLIGLPTNLIGILYVYAVIQPLFITFEIKKIPFEINVFETWHNVFNVILASAMIVALVLKIYFFLIVRYAIESGKVFNYLFCIPLLTRRVGSIFDNQFEIFIYRNILGDKHCFNFQIKKNNALIYSTDSLFDTREQCLHTILEFRKAMVQEEAYLVKEAEGMVWIEVLWPEKNIACVSHTFHSKDEALHLIQESMEEIPYCKLNYN